MRPGSWPDRASSSRGQHLSQPFVSMLAVAGFSMKLALSIALSHLLSHRRQTLVSLLGITLGVAFFMAVTSLMQGSDADFIKRLVDSSPHVTSTTNTASHARSPSFKPTPARRWNCAA